MEGLRTVLLGDKLQRTEKMRQDVIYFVECQINWHLKLKCTTNLLNDLIKKFSSTNILYVSLVIYIFN